MKVVFNILVIFLMSVFCNQAFAFYKLDLRARYKQVFQTRVNESIREEFLDLQQNSSKGKKELLLKRLRELLYNKTETI